MANLQDILRASGGSLQTAEQMALEAVANGRHEFWLDLALVLSVQGKFTGARQAQAKYLEAFPNCPRVRFGMAPFALADGELQSGLNLLEFGRQIDCWGKSNFNTSAPLWDGTQDISGKTVLSYGEGGLGDEVLGFRAAAWAVERGAKCILACARELMPLAATSGASAVVDVTLANAVHADYGFPSMSAPRLFNRSWETLWISQYVFQKPSLDAMWKKLIRKESSKLNVGIRWRGNPKFEHEQLRTFDPESLFKATDTGVTRWSLQKDERIVLPETVNDLEPFLTSWEHTVAAMAQLDLVITSCTSIAHVAGAMNIPTWVVVPVMPYYCWGQPGQKTSWYPSVTVYRQEKYGDWSRPFEQVGRDLESLVKGEEA